MRTTVAALLAILICAPFLLAQPDAKKMIPETYDHEYVGVEECALCHHTESQGNQYDIWKGTRHAQAFHTLTTDAADQIAESLGYETPASENPKCLKCHATAFNADAKYLGPYYKVTDGVQCETCHGPGGDYTKWKVMQDYEVAVEKGLIIHHYKIDFCAECHNEESPTYKVLDFDDAWKLIAHPLPPERNNK